MGIFLLDFPIFVDDVVQGVQTHGTAKPYQYVAYHFVDLDAPLYGGNAIRVDRMQHIKVKEVELLFLLVEQWLYQCGIGENEVLIESCVKLYVHLEWLP